MPMDAKQQVHGGYNGYMVDTMDASGYDGEARARQKKRIASFNQTLVLVGAVVTRSLYRALSLLAASPSTCCHMHVAVTLISTVTI